ncbi:MAG: carbamoyl-phosphate synthase (glutamine-hydrolyzing) large subunit, partial [Candidatus Thorarchaeota archaeon]
DGSNEGLYHEIRPYFSVQFHPEANAGPRDTEYLFDLFLENKVHHFIDNMQNEKQKLPVSKKKKVLILGSGALSIGQAGEFDYSGSQAVKAYKEEGIYTVLINPNIATVQTSSNFVDKIYYLPITPEFIEQVIENEQPDCISVSFGGQTALNATIELCKNGILKKHGVEILGTSVETVIDTEDRERFKYRLSQINEYCVPSKTVNNLEDGINVAEELGYPVLVRAAFTLGGLGSGFVNNRDELIKLLQKTFTKTDQVIIDKSLKGWKELEYEMVRDRYDNTISVCNMENIDPLGVHTGESIVVAPSQTLTDEEYNLLRSVAIKVVKHLGVVGECNIQYALNPDSLEYYIIEVNARLSRSSALASKATGYPLAYIAAKLGLGYSLLELKNSITKKTTACFEPSLDYCVVKVPYWDLKKFPFVDKRIGSSMKSIGEAMGISRGFEEAFQKALRMTNVVDGFDPNLIESTEDELINPSYDRILGIATAIYHDRYSIEELYKLTKIDRWFLYKFRNIINMMKKLEKNSLNRALLLESKKLGFSDKQISKSVKSTEIAIRNMRKHEMIKPCTKQIDTVAGEFPCYTNYLYLTYNGFESDIKLEKDNSIIVLGSGVYKIGSSVEFDWCIVNSVRRIRELKYKAIMINCNPETVSTDYDEADRLYFDVLNFETVMDIYEMENPNGIILSMGGQIPNNIAMSLHKQKAKVIGTTPDMIDNAENRYKFSRMLDTIGVDQPKWKELVSIDEAIEFCKSVEFPCLVRPSYVLSGAAMNVVNCDSDLRDYLSNALENRIEVSKDHPVVISKYISDAKEIEVDAVAKNGDIKIYAISEHVENAGVHSGDATLILPSQDLTKNTVNKIRDSIYKIAKELLIDGPFNIQFIAKDDEIKVIECNLRASRSFPFVSKTLDVNFAKYAIDMMLNVKNDEKIVLKKDFVGVKVPKFSFDRLEGADMVLGVEMMSTGEVACFGRNHYEAYLKGLIGTGFKLPPKGGKIFISIGSYKHKKEFIQSMQLLDKMGYQLYGSKGTSDYYNEHGINMRTLMLDEVNVSSIVKQYQENSFDLIINVSIMNSKSSKNTYGYLVRRIAIDLNIPLITDIKCAKLLITSLNKYQTLPVIPYIDSQTSYNTIRLPGLIDVHVHVREPGGEEKEDWETCSKSA